MTTTKPTQVRVVSTPNPQAIKFFLPHMLSTGGLYHDFDRAGLDQAPPLPKALLETFKALTNVFVMQNFLTLTKTNETDWQTLVPQVQSFLIDYLDADKSLEITSDTASNTASSTTQAETPTITQRIIKVLDEYVKPAVARDGGVIVFDSYEAGLVKVRLKGACSGCPSATLTLKGGIERLLKSMLPEIEAVEAIEDPT